MSGAQVAVAGVVAVDKPAGVTSHDVVARARRALGTRKVGHAGTLDPDATGVLVLGVGRATRLLQFLAGLDKEYEGTLAFGTATDTLDASGAVVDRHPMDGLSGADVVAAAARFKGPILQVPPMVSAIKVGGRPLHARARAGEVIERAPRPVTIHALAVRGFIGGPYPEATVTVRCSAGTYIRSLAADLGAALGGCAHLSSLRRTAVGSFTLAGSLALDDLAPESLLPPLRAVDDLPRLAVDDEQARAVGFGTVFASLGCPVDGPVAITHGGDLIAVYGPHARGAKPIVVLAPN